MDEKDIRRYAGLMQELGLTGLEITENDRVVRLERAPAEPKTVQIPVPMQVPAAAPAPAGAPAGEDPGLSVVRSPLVGIFYAAPAENAVPYVSPGDRVTKGQTLCIIESMKLMNEIPAEEDGIVEEICAANGQAVEFGTELFHIRRQP